jgi:hypothetical protein
MQKQEWSLVCLPQSSFILALNAIPQSLSTLTPMFENAINAWHNNDESNSEIIHTI